MELGVGEAIALVSLMVSIILALAGVAYKIGELRRQVVTAESACSDNKESVAELTRKLNGNLEDLRRGLGENTEHIAGMKATLDAVSQRLEKIDKRIFDV